MAGWLGSAYLTIKALHVIMVIFWIAGLFMLPRYLVYQAETAIGSAEDHNWRRRTIRIRRIILTPAMLLSWAFGLMLATSFGFAAHWLHLKILLVLGLTAYHFWLLRTAGRMANGERPVAEKTLRLVNEVPGIATILIVFLVILKPF